MEMQDITFAGLLKNYTDQKAMKADQLMTSIQHRFPAIPEWKDQDEKKRCVRAIENWLYRSVKKPRAEQWPLVVAMAVVLALKEYEAEQLLQAAGMKTLGSLRQGASEMYQELFEAWMKPVFAEKVQGSLTGLEEGQEEQGSLIRDIHTHILTAVQTTELPLDLIAAEATYRRRVVEAHQWLKFSGFDRSDLSLLDVPLEKIFVRLSLTVERVVRGPAPKDLANGSQQRERVTSVQEPIELGQALSNHLLIIGEQGGGKSTLLRWLAVTFAESRQRDSDRIGSSADSDRLPILVELGRLPDRYLKPEATEIPNWLQFLPQYLASQMAFTGTPPQLLTQALTKGRCLLLFDGLDEVANREARARLARSLADLARHMPHNRVIIGSRPAGVSESESALCPPFQRCQIERFKPEDIQRFFRFWYALDHSLSSEQQERAIEALVTRLWATPTTLQLATTPLLATILLLLWRNTGNLPERRVDLYEYCCRVLIERWEISHDVVHLGVLTKLDWKDHLHLLSSLAYFIHSQEQRTSVMREELLPLLAQTLQTAGYASERVEAVREAKHFLDALGLRSGLLQYVGDDRYSFPHLTFQEYLAARHIAEQLDPDYIDMVMEHLHEEWWQQVHLLTIAHLGSSPVGCEKASFLILTILHAYSPPTWFWCSSGNMWLRLIGPGKLWPQVQLERRIAWVQAREFEFAAKSYMECVPISIEAEIETILLARAVSLMRHIFFNWGGLRGEQRALLDVACQVLQRQGDKRKVVEILLKTLRHRRRWRAHILAAESLGKLGGSGEEVVLTLLVALDTDGATEAAIAECLRKLGMGNQMARILLGVALHDTDKEVRGLAVKSLRDLGVRNEVALALLAALYDMGASTRYYVARNIGKLGVGSEEIMNALLVALHNADKEVRKVAAESLGDLGVGNEKVAQALLVALHDVDDRVQERAAESLGKLGVGSKEVMGALLVALHDAGAGVRYYAARSLKKLGGGNKEVMDTLLGALHDPGEGGRYYAAEILGKLGVGNKEVAQALLVALHDADKGIRGRAAESLGEVGVGSEKVIDALLVALHDVDKEVQRLAVKSLGDLGVGNEKVAQALLVALHDADKGVRERVAESLGEVGVGSEEVIDALLVALHDVDKGVRERSVESLGKLGVGNEEVAQALLVALHDADDRVRGQAAESLGQLGVGDEEVMKVLLADLRNADWGVRDQAARRLGQLNIKSATQLLHVLKALNYCLHSHDVDVRQTALASIRQLLEGQPIPGYRWVPLRKRGAQKRRLKWIAFWLCTIAFMGLISLISTKLLGILDPNNFFALLLVGIIVFAGVALVLNRTLHTP